MTFSFWRCLFFEQKAYLLFLLSFSYIHCSFAQFTSFPHEYLKIRRSIYALDSGEWLIVKDKTPVNVFEFFRPVTSEFAIAKMKNFHTDDSDFIMGLANDEWKISPSLKKVLKAGRVDHARKFVISTMDVGASVKKLQAADSRILSVDFASRSIAVKLYAMEDVYAVIRFEEVTFVDVYKGDPFEETLNPSQDLAVNSINDVHLRYPYLDGEGMSLSVRERAIDPGDIDFKGRIIISDLQDPIVSLHANQMATVIAGGGNTSESSKGIAWRSKVSSASFVPIFPDSLNYFQSSNISVQNHSYGFELDNVYSAVARAYDVQVNNNNQLLHVFSAGNRGEESADTGTYAEVNGYANLTGSVKMAKNILVVGAHYDDFTIDPRNSRGPAFDGRMKPELVAYGPDGTSEGAAYASGVALLLQQEFKRINGSIPPSSLLRLAMTLSASDLGQPGPDYYSGYGALNATKAVEVIHHSLFKIDGVGSNEIHEAVVVDVPSGCVRLRAGLSWNDPAAEAGANRALVNDLDLRVHKEGSSEIHLPWILNTFPHADSLSVPAKKGKDNLNNLEIVTIDFPAPGKYVLEVEGGEVTGQQEYSVAFMLDTASTFRWTYPSLSAKLESDSDIKIRWQTTMPGMARLLVEMNGSESELSDQINLAQGWFDYRVPEGVNELVFKMVTADGEFVSATIIAMPIMDFQVGFTCSDESLLVWNPSRFAQSYVLYNLGEEYLNSVHHDTDTSFQFLNAAMSEYFAIAPVVGLNIGKRSITRNYKASGVNCYYSTFQAFVDSDSQARLRLQLSTLSGVQSVLFQKKHGPAYETLDQVSVNHNMILEVTDGEVSGGPNTYRAGIVLAGGSTVFTNEAILIFADKNTHLVYPNPIASGSSVLNIVTNGDGLIFELIDSRGRKMLEQPLKQTVMELDVSLYPSGMYLYRIIKGTRVEATGRVILD